MTHRTRSQSATIQQTWHKFTHMFRGKDVEEE